jgi:hypothetical protein
MRALLLLTAFLAAALPAQSVRARLDGRVPAASIPAIDSLAQVAMRESLPTDLLIVKAIEGGAKGASSEQIVTAVVQNLNDLRIAKALLVRAGDAPPITSGEVLIVASARKRGVSALALERIVTALPNERRGAALHALADLVMHQFDPDSAADLVLRAAHMGMRGGRLLDVSNAAIQDLQRGRTRSEALADIRGRLPNVPAQAAPRSMGPGLQRPSTTATSQQQ